MNNTILSLQPVRLWLCPVCGRKKWQGCICRVCGYDAGMDYSTYRTICDIPAGTGSLDAKLEKRMQEEEQRQNAQRLEQQRKAEEEKEEKWQRQLDSMKSQLMSSYDRTIRDCQAQNTLLQSKYRELESKVTALQHENDELKKQVAALSHSITSGQAKTQTASSIYASPAKTQTASSIYASPAKTQTSSTAYTSQPRSYGSTSTVSTASQTGYPQFIDRTYLTGSQNPKRSVTEMDLRRQIASGPKEITFGRYPQSNGCQPEPIKWLVLERNEKGVLLLSKYVLDGRTYNDQKKSDITWGTSSLRLWLSGTFLRQAFTDNERKCIWTVKNENNVPGKAEGGAATEDQIFLLSKKEAVKYLTSSYERTGTLTKYARSRGAYVFRGDDIGRWWLRDTGVTGEKAMNVGANGYVDTEGSNVDFALAGVRPAMWVKANT